MLKFLTNNRKDLKLSKKRKYTEHEEKLRFYHHVEDSLLDSFSYKTLITAVQCNEKVRDEKAIRKVFNELLESRIQDSKDMLNLMMDKLKKEVKN